MASTGHCHFDGYVALGCVIQKLAIMIRFAMKRARLNGLILLTGQRLATVSNC